MVNNIERLRDTLKFDKFGEFYYISIMQRNKDGVKVVGSHDNARRIRTFYVFSIEEFDKIIPFIMEICDKMNARAFILSHISIIKGVILSNSSIENT